MSESFIPSNLGNAPALIRRSAKPEAPSPKPKTQNPKPQPLSPKPYPDKPQKPRTLNHKAERQGPNGRQDVVGLQGLTSWLMNSGTQGCRVRGHLKHTHTIYESTTPYDTILYCTYTTLYFGVHGFWVLRLGLQGSTPRV